LGANGCWEGRGREHGGHYVDAGDPGLHLLCVARGERRRRSNRGQKNDRIQKVKQYMLKETAHSLGNEQLTGGC